MRTFDPTSGWHEWHYGQVDYFPQALILERIEGPARSYEVRDRVTGHVDGVFALYSEAVEAAEGEQGPPPTWAQLHRPRPTAADS